MILSVSRRTDIPAFYSDWFYNRIKEGFVYVRNPMNIHQISKINIAPEVVDCIVFWTKNPQKMMNRLNELQNYNYYFQFTINPYDQQLELNVPRKNSIIEVFKELSDKIGGNKVIWRYDPILLSRDVDINYHIKYFEEIAKRLSPFTSKCTISFIDNYKKTENNLKGTGSKELSNNDILYLSKQLVRMASSYGIEIQTCAEKIDLETVGVKHGRCIDNAVIENIIGYQLDAKKDKNQRPECGCIESIDIGEYNTCPHNCLYCYANFNKEQVLKKREQHNPYSPLLIGNITNKDTIKERRVVSLRKKGLFE
jgi:DNA repair photolyase